MNHEMKAQNCLL